MKNLIRAELRKTFTTSAWWVLLLCMTAWIGLSLAMVVATAGMQGLPGRDDPGFAPWAWPQAATGAIFAMVLGILSVTTEFQHRTITPTFLAEPRRGRVVAAKLVAAAGTGVFLGVVAIALTSAVLIPSILLSGGSLHLADNQVPRILMGSLTGYVLYALLGLALGTLVRHQIGALVIGVLWAMLVEPVLTAIPPLSDVTKWLPGSAVAALYDTGMDLSEFGLGGDLLPVWIAALTLLGYVALFTLVASATTLRRDIA
ncbi:ABC transporter permease [Nocardiopsis sp. N85]|uniref:ABC transporter permease n=1 Tax=Nocardiopsis sp. N85 TaxID=3029400 RepID=UPI00237F2BB2|nr:ABC transporter permease [Nocardiopsis sp. N85]MDE3723113.1 ABC transporter permease [Nocardiopsis sp. N85]